MEDEELEQDSEDDKQPPLYHHKGKAVPSVLDSLEDKDAEQEAVEEQIHEAAEDPVTTETPATDNQLEVEADQAEPENPAPLVRSSRRVRKTVQRFTA